MTAGTPLAGTLLAGTLVAESVSLRRGARGVLDDVSLEVSGGTVLGVAGPGGSGKTALLAVLAGVARPTSGRVAVMGTALFPVHRRDARRARRLVGYVPPARPLDDPCTVREHLLLHARCHGVGRRQRPGLVDALLELLDLAPVAGVPVAGTPPAVTQLVALARALVPDPPVLLLDDPTRPLDPGATDEVLDLVVQLSSLGKAIVVAAEPGTVALDVATHVAELEQGRVVRFSAVD